nr:hypothetical transcript [Hymenolepis microstoma]
MSYTSARLPKLQSLTPPEFCVPCTPPNRLLQSGPSANFSLSAAYHIFRFHFQLPPIHWVCRSSVIRAFNLTIGLRFECIDSFYKNRPY